LSRAVRATICEHSLARNAEGSSATSLKAQ
jgi:hypothetical protein